MEAPAPLPGSQAPLGFGAAGVRVSVSVVLPVSPPVGSPEGWPARSFPCLGLYQAQGEDDDGSRESQSEHLSAAAELENRPVSGSVRSPQGTSCGCRYGAWNVAVLGSASPAAALSTGPAAARTAAAGSAVTAGLAATSGPEIPGLCPVPMP